MTLFPKVPVYENVTVANLSIVVNIESPRLMLLISSSTYISVYPHVYPHVIK